LTLWAEFSFFYSFSRIFKHSHPSNMIKIRLQRHGARHSPFYRMVVTPSQVRRDGRFIEVLGTYNPQSSARERELDLKMDRIDHWLQVGAQPTDTAKSLIKQGRLSPEEWLKRADANANAKAARAAKKKNPAPVAEAPAVAEEAPAEEPKGETEQPKEETKAEESSPVEEKAKSNESGAEEKKENAEPVENSAPQSEAKESPSSEADSTPAEGKAETESNSAEKEKES
jgi:small subunit ribosomal protein S16